jgi:acetoin utilization protein AcuB
MRLQDIMRTDVKTVGMTAAGDAAWALMREARIRHLVVLERGTVRGVISERDLGGARGSSVRKNHTVAELMTEDPFCVTSKTTIREAANLMRGRSIGCLPVVDGKKVVGIVTVTDMLELIGRGGMAAPGSTGKTRWKPVHRMEREPHVGARH